IHTGPVTIDNDVFVGEAAVLDIGTVIEDGAQLGHASSLQVGQRVPEGKRYHGSPAQETTANYASVEPRDCTSLRRWSYSIAQLAFGLAVISPLSILALYYVLPAAYNASNAAGLDHFAPGPGLWLLAGEMLLVSLAIFMGAL